MNNKDQNELQAALALCKDSFVTAGIFSFFVNLLMLVPPFYMLQVYDRVVSSGNTVTLWMLTLIMVFLIATMGGLQWVRSRVLVRVSSRLDTELGDKLYNVSFRQALFSSGTQTSAQPLQDLNGLRTFLTGPGFFAFFDAPWLPIFLMVMYWFHPLYGLVGVISAIILIIIAFLNERATAGYMAQANSKQQAAQRVATTNLRNAEVIESMGMLDNIRARWKESNKESLYWQAIASDHASTFQSVSRFFRMVSQSLILGLGAWLVLQQEITPGLMIAGSILLGRALAPIDLMIGSWKGFVTARTQYERLNDLLDKIPGDRENMSLPEPVGEITVDRAVVAPPGSRVPVLKGISCEFKQGDTVAIIGPSASGKSTLARALLGIWPAAQGHIRLDGADIQHYNRHELGPFTGYLPQDIELFDGTVSENIARFGEIDSEKVIEAAQMAGVHELIYQLVDGYDTRIGQSGNALSAGQRQRIGLARALYGNPVFIVLDEPNSNLDDAGDRALAEAVARLKDGGCTTVIITHKPNILNLVDKILLLNEGTVAAFGPREQVLEEMRQAQQQAALQKVSTPANTAPGSSQETVVVTSNTTPPNVTPISKD